MKILNPPNLHQLHSSFLLLLIIQPLSSVEGLHLTADNIQYHATFIDSSVSIQGRAINVAAGSSNKEKILEVPIGHIDAHASIIITVGLNNTQPNTPGVDSDLVVGVSDGTNSNSWGLLDINNYSNLPPCYIWPGEGTFDDTRVSSTTRVSAIAKFIYSPFHKYGSCETAQEGGYINTGRFNAQLDVTKPLLLQVRRDGAGEQYSLFYLFVEIVTN